MGATSINQRLEGTSKSNAVVVGFFFSIWNCVREKLHICTTMLEKYGQES